MSHFFERLASSVTKPAGTAASQPALRPLLGSIYAPARTHAAGVRSFPLEEERIETSAGDKLENAARTARHSEPVELNLQAAHAESEPLPSQHSAGALPPETSLRPEALLPDVNAVARSTDFADLLPASTHDFASARNDRESASRLQRKDGAPRTDLRTVIDLLMRPSQQETPSITYSAASQSANGGARSASREFARRAEQAAHEPDEITINIGRIEVTAVPQPAVRPAPAPARRSVSLDEYLKRGNGRAR